ncbi:MAG TPA: amidase [Dongiaceae bacterium]|nr:amidase [Dongiaceae bacterium]
MTYQSLDVLRAALQSRKVSAVELSDQAIARIEALDGKFNAVVVRDFDRARTAAKDADAAIARGEDRPLLGLSMTVKECFNVAGLVTTWGIAGTEGNRVDFDSVAVARLKAAGAIILGKTNVPTMLMDWQSYNPIYGITNNPWDVTRTPGGSSGGGAAALAAGFVPLEFGSDLGGSLRVPAHCCGVFAHKPTHGIVPMRNMSPPGSPQVAVSAPVDLAVVGPMARSAGDLSLVLDIVAGPDQREAVGYRLDLPPARHARLADFRVLLLDAHPLVPTDPAIRAAFGDLARKLEKAGCIVDRSSPLLPDLAQIAATFTELLMSFVGADMPDAEYKGARAAVDALPPEAPAIQAAHMRGLTLSHRDWIRADRRRAAIAGQWRAFFQAYDVVLCPVMPNVAFPHDHRPMMQREIVVDGKVLPYGLQGIWAGLANVTGQPATAMPIGLSPEGLPIGMQIIGPYLEDRTTLQFARLVEREFGGFVPPPALR